MGKRYENDFKIEAVRLASEPGNPQACIEKDLGLGQGVSRRWKRELAKMARGYDLYRHGVRLVVSDGLY